MAAWQSRTQFSTQSIEIQITSEWPRDHGMWAWGYRWVSGTMKSNMAENCFSIARLLVDEIVVFSWWVTVTLDLELHPCETGCDSLRHAVALSSGTSQESYSFSWYRIFIVFIIPRISNVKLDWRTLNRVSNRWEREREREREKTARSNSKTACIFDIVQCRMYANMTSDEWRILYAC